MADEERLDAAWRIDGVKEFRRENKIQFSDDCSSVSFARLANM